jgi:hypothetical protein
MFSKCIGPFNISTRYGQCTTSLAYMELTFAVCNALTLRIRSFCEQFVDIFLIVAMQRKREIFCL